MENLGTPGMNLLGVVAAIAPLNFPFWLSCSKLAHALAAGNSVILKPPEQTPLSTLILGEIAFEVGLPKGKKLPILINWSEMRIAKEEIFGPVQQILMFSNIEEAIDRANNSEHGLAAAVFTNDLSEAHYVAHALEAGQVWVNDFMPGGVNTPFGGYKKSGIGRKFGADGLLPYLEIKTVLIKLWSTLWWRRNHFQFFYTSDPNWQLKIYIKFNIIYVKYRMVFHASRIQMYINSSVFVFQSVFINTTVLNNDSNLGST